MGRDSVAPPFLSGRGSEPEEVTYPVTMMLPISTLERYPLHVIDMVGF